MLQNLTIVICDDDIIQLETFRSFLINYNLEIISSTSGADLLNCIKNRKIDIAFLDIEMAIMNGLELGKQIRNLNNDTIIVYITGHKDYGFDSFNVKPFDYILKPINHERFKKLFNEVLARYHEIYVYKNLNNTLTLSTKDSVIKLKYNEIYYFENSSEN